LPLKDDQAEADHVYTPLIKLYMAQDNAVPPFPFFFLCCRGALGIHILCCRVSFGLVIVWRGVVYIHSPFLQIANYIPQLVAIFSHVLSEPELTHELGTRIAKCTPRLLLLFLLELFVASLNDMCLGVRQIMTQHGAQLNNLVQSLTPQQRENINKCAHV